MVQISADPQRDRQRREILQVASDVFRRRGFHAAGMRDIAAELGIAVGKLYYWFESKDALLAYCQEECLRGLLQVADEGEAASSDAAEQLYFVAVGHVLCLTVWLPGSLAHLEVESLRSPHRERVQRLRDRYESCLRRLIAAGVQKHRFRWVDPKLAALWVLGSVNWTVKWFRPGGALPPQHIAQTFAEHSVRGLLGESQTFHAPNGLPFSDLKGLA